MLALRLFTYTIACIMLLPVVITGMLAFTSQQNLAFPPPGYSFRWIVNVLTDPYMVEAISRSFRLAIITAFLSTLICIFFCLVVDRGLGQKRDSLESIVTSPRMIPEMILAIALLIFFERILIAETFTGLVISHLVVCVPFAYRTMIVGIGSLDRRLEWSSDILGASPVRGFFRIIMPQLKTPIISSLVFTFVLSFNDVSMALFLSKTGERTLPVEMFLRTSVAGLDPTIPAISFILTIAALVLFIVVDRTIGTFDRLVGH